MSEQSLGERMLRAALKLSRERWKKSYASMSFEEQRELAITIAGRAWAGKQEEMHYREKDSQVTEQEVYTGDPDIIDTKGPLGNGSGGGKRVVRGTKSLS